MAKPDHFILRDYHAARAQGEMVLAARHWDDLLVNNFDRLKGRVSAFTFKGTTQHLPEHERDAAVSEVFLRARAMGADFSKREIGAFYAALHTCVFNTCMDYGRKELRHDIKAAGSLDKRYPDSDEAGPYDGALADYAEELAERTKDAIERHESEQEAAALVGWGIGQIKNDGYREVLELTYGEKLDGDAIADRLDLTKANVYQRRKRGIKELERILRGS